MSKKNITWYSLSQLLAKLFSFVFSIFTRRLLGPASMGAVTSVLIIERLLDNLFAPIRSFLEREVPQAIGMEDKAKITLLIQSSFSLVVFNILLGSATFVILSITETDNTIKSAYHIVALVMFFKHERLLFQALLKSFSKFKYVSILILLFSMILPLSQLIASYIWGINGYFIAMLFSNLICFLIAYSFIRHIRIEYGIYILRKIRLINIKEVYWLGFPLVLFGFIVSLTQMSDKLFIKHFYEITELGYYNIADMLFVTASILPLSIVGVVYPQFMANYRNATDSENILFIEQKSTQIRNAALIVISLAIPLSDLMYHYLLPQFLPGKLAGKIILLSVYFAVNYQMYYMHLIAIKKISKLNIIAGATLLLGIVLNLTAVTIDMGLKGIALATFITYMIMSSSIVLISSYYLSGKNSMLGTMIRKNIPIFFPLIIFVGDMFISDPSLNTIILKALVVFLINILLYYRKHQVFN